VDAALRTLQRKLGIQPARSFHTLRHYFATTLLRGGAHVETVRQLLRQRDLATTTRYVYAVAGDLGTAVLSLPQSVELGNSGERALMQ